MRTAIEKRVASLETQASTADASLKLVFVEAGESSADALKRARYPPDADADVICVSFIATGYAAP